MLYRPRHSGSPPQNRKKGSAGTAVAAPLTDAYGAADRAADRRADRDVQADIASLDYVTITSRVVASVDDAEEAAATGEVGTTSSDLELVDDPSHNGLQSAVGVRFRTLSIPQGALISSAYITITAEDDDGLDAVDLRIFAEDSDDVAEFTTENYSLTDRPWTHASVAWAPSVWDTKLVEHATPDLAVLVQVVVNCAG